nr:reverse transcriptase domain-containing protein [Tanacetum cinerariifolium]
MAAPVIFISSNVSVESVGSSFLRVILIVSTSVEVSVAPEVGEAAVASPAGVLELDTYSSSEADPSESSLPPVSVAPMVSPFRCLDDSESDTEIPERHIPTAPILPAPFAIVAPSSEFPLAPVVASPRIRRRRAILIRPEEDIPIGRLYRTHHGGPCKELTVRKSVRHLPSHRLALRYTSHRLDHFTSGSSSSHSSSDHSSSGHSSLGHSLLGHTPPRFIHPPLARTPRCSEAYLCWRSLAATVISYIYATRDLVTSRADLLPPRERFRNFISPEDSVEEDIDTDVLEDIEADVIAVEVAIDRDAEDGIDAVTIPSLRLLRLRRCMGASVDHLSTGLKLEIVSSLAQRSSTRRLRRSFKSRVVSKLPLIIKKAMPTYEGTSRVSSKVMLKVSTWKGVIRFGKRGKLNPHYIGPFKIIAKVGTVAYRLELPKQLSRVYSMFHVSNLKK